MSGEWDGANVCDEWDVNFQVSGTRYCFLSTRREQTSESTKDSNECDGVEISRERDTVMLKINNVSVKTCPFRHVKRLTIEEVLGVLEVGYCIFVPFGMLAVVCLDT